MKKLLLATIVAVSLMSMPLLANNGNGNDNEEKTAKVAREMAVELCAAAMGSGAYQHLDVSALSRYCVELAVQLVHANYHTP